MALPALAENRHTEEPRVFINNGKALTTSKDVAEYFGKRHERVLDKIRNLDCSSKFTEHNFVPSEYTDSTGRKLPMYTMTKDGFVFLVMGFTGKKAAAFKEAYIAEFNRMEAELYAIPKYKPQTAELFNDDDTRCLTHLVWSMANGFHFDRAWTQAIWYALRRVTGVPSPQHFEIRQLPLLAEECRRIYSITNTLKGAIFDAEKQTIRRVLRHREDEAIVLGEMQQMLEESTQQHYGVMTHALEKWQQANVNQFLQRH
ncbi:Rha family transcriptional regulator [Symbiopectobacterium purcellii]|uniref:Rha family transcriptional regulator n=1 Tax=Symbiopectobacterium purcellii TaxID=2871826 RepID=UPI003F835DF9